MIALGSNLGDSARLLAQAMDDLQRLATVPILRSSLWRTSPVDCPPGSPVFLNAVVLLTPKPGETPESLLQKLGRMEAEFGRNPKQVLNEARPLDLDLIAFYGETRSTPELVLPHPRFHQRRFVLAPLHEIGAAWILPGMKSSVAELLANWKGDEVVDRFPP